jgi:S-DNA-T family DNA segregation ATPase FtsK/SpoIIIE
MRRRSIRKIKPTRYSKKSLNLELSQAITHEICAIIYGCLALITILSINGAAGPIGDSFRHYMEIAFGRGIWFFPTALIIMSLSLFLSRKVNIHTTKLIGILLAFTSILGLIHMQTPFTNQNESIEVYGGYTGFVISVLPRLFLDDTAAIILLTSLLLIGLTIVFELSLSKIIQILNPFNLIKISINNKEKNDEIVKIIKPITEENNDHPEKVFQLKAIKKNETNPIIKKPVPAKNDDQIKMEEKDYLGWEMPALDLLEKASSKLKIDERILVKNASRIKEKLSQFGIEVSMKDINVGPTVTQYTLQPHEGIKLTKITTLKNDIALALAAKSIRIEAPIPGKSLVGIEMPNENRMIVHLREMIESEEFASMPSNLKLAVGRDVSGKPIIRDLSKMPHLLIAGRTGAGKSVCMNTFLLSLLYQNSPRDLKFILIDPKRVELMPYNGIPHLLTSVITDVDKAIAALKWAVAEMSRRYHELSQKGYRNISEYNENEFPKINNIVVVVDELADLMMRQNRKETELLICRLAQMARAVGLHLIIATQRPSVDVITGLIKANIPSRIAFAVASGVDSRTILDSIGAEDLLGLGDMLMTTNDMEGMIRIQGILVSRREIERVTNKLKLTLDTTYKDQINFSETTPEPPIDPELEEQIDLNAIDIDDDKFNEALAVVKSTGKASATLLQRHLSIGYARAAKLLDLMEEKGMIGPANGAKPREIFFQEKEEPITV